MTEVPRQGSHCCSGVPVCLDYRADWVICLTCGHGPECHVEAFQADVHAKLRGLAGVVR